MNNIQQNNQIIINKIINKINEKNLKVKLKQSRLTMTDHETCNGEVLMLDVEQIKEDLKILKYHRKYPERFCLHYKRLSNMTKETLLMSRLSLVFKSANLKNLRTLSK